MLKNGIKNRKTKDRWTNGIPYDFEDTNNREVYRDEFDIFSRTLMPDFRGFFIKEDVREMNLDENRYYQFKIKPYTHTDREFYDPTAKEKWKDYNRNSILTKNIQDHSFNGQALSFI